MKFLKKLLSLINVLEGKKTKMDVSDIASGSGVFYCLWNA